MILNNTNSICEFFWESVEKSQAKNRLDHMKISLSHFPTFPQKRNTGFLAVHGIEY